MRRALFMGVLWLVGGVFAGCGYLEGGLSRTGVTVGRGREERPCAWLPDERAQWQLRRSAVRDKVQRLVVPAMHAAELDAWLIVEREFQRDPMMDALGLTDPGDKAVLLVDGGGTQPRAFAFGSSWQLASAGLFEKVQPLTPEALTATLDLFRPRRIGINYSARVPLADGIATGSRQFAAWLVGHQYAGTFRSAEALVVAFRSRRTPDEIELARQAARCAVEIVEQELSRTVAGRGDTTAADLSARLAAAIHDALLETRSIPRVSVLKRDSADPRLPPSLAANSDAVIAAGDLVHADLDLRYAGVAGTAQRTAYVRSRWELELPADIRRAFAAIEQARNGLAPLFRPGQTGRQIAAEVAAQAKERGIGLDLAGYPVGNEARDVGTLLPSASPVLPYDAAGAVADRPLQAGDLQLLALRVTVALDDGRHVMLSGADTGVVGFGGLDFLVSPQRELIH